MSLEYFMYRYRWQLMAGLRISLGLIYVWFGGLKALGYNPVYDIVHASFPLLATPQGNIILGIFETLIGLGLIFDLYHTVIHVALLLHLLGTSMVFIVAPRIMFQPYFPILTLSGEFVFKNLTLAMAGLVTLAYGKNRRERS